MNKIKVLNPNNLPTIPYQSMEPFQEDLKIISQENIEKLARSIVENDFFKAKTVFKLKDKFLLADGHQTKKALEFLETVGLDGEKYEIPEIPVEIINVKSKKEASLKLLAIVSQFGEFNEKTSFFNKFQISDKQINKFSFQTNFKGFGKKLNLEEKAVVENLIETSESGFDEMTDQAISDLSEISDIETYNEDHPEEAAENEISKQNEEPQISNYIIRYELIFEDESQQDTWYNFLKVLKTKYPDSETIGSRVTQFIKENINE